MSNQKIFKAAFKSIKFTLAMLLSWQVGIGLPIAVAEQSLPVTKAQSKPHNDPVSPQQFTSDLLTGFKNKISESNPLYLDFLKQGPLPEELRPRFNPNDRGLDKDPFFLRSQKWNGPLGLTGGKDWSFTHLDDQVLLFHESWKVSIRIDQPLRPLIETADYILFSVHENSDLIESKVPGLDEKSEGLFYINKRDLLAQYKSAEVLGFNSSAAIGAPVFFFPLPGEGWKGRLNIVESVMNDEVVLQNNLDNTILPIEFKDLALLEKIQRMNLMFGQAITLFEQREERLAQVSDHIRKTGEVSPFVLPLPAVDSTKGFGLFLSGKMPHTANKKGFFSEAGQKLLRSIHSSLLPEARADGFLETVQSLITPDVWERVHFLNTLLFGSAVGAVALKYTTYRDLFKKRYPAVKSTLKEKVWNEAKGNLDVYTHMLVTVTYTVGMSILTSVEYLLDRFATKSGGPKNGMLRVLFNNTMGWSRAQSSKLATNWKTFFLGALVMGGIDSALVVFQLLIFTPMLLEQLGWQTTTAAAAVGTTAVAAFVTSEILHNIYAYFKTGAFSYSADQKFLVMDQVRIFVDRDLRRQGKDPTDPEIQSERKKKISELMNQRMAQMGLPTDKDFLFDHNTVIEKVAQASGFGLTKDEISILKDEIVMQTGRWGLAYPTLKKAYKAAVQLQSENPSETGAQTVETLKKALGHFRMSEATIRKIAKSIVVSRTQASDQLELPLTEELTAEERRKSFLENPGKYLKALGSKLSRSTIGSSRDVRKTISLMSYTGKAEEVLPLLPKGWIEEAGSREVAELSARLIRNSFLSITQGDAELLIPGSETQEQFREETEEILRWREKEGAAPDKFTRKIQGIEIVKSLRAEKKKEDLIANYKPKKMGWFERLQHRRARKFAEQKILAESNQQLSDKTQQDYRKAYLKKLARISGLYLMDPETSEFTRKVEEKAIESLETQFKLPEEQAYLSKLNESDRRAYEAQVFTEHFFDAYFQMSVMSDEYLEANAPEQPGRFQWLRQKLIGKPGYDRFYHRVLRVGDAFFEDSIFRPGLMNFISGKIPLIPEMGKMFVRNLRILPYFASFGYFTNYYIWQVKMDYAVWIFYFLLAFYGPVAVAFNNRVMKNFGVKPMGDWWSKAKYSFLHSWMTYPTFIPVMMFADPVVNWWGRNISGPITTAISYCAKLLGG